MKKLLAMIMAVMMVMAMAGAAFASSTPEYTAGTAPSNMSAAAAITFTVDKSVTIKGTGASLPAQSVAVTQLTSNAYTYVKYNDDMTAETELGDAITTFPTLTVTAAALTEGDTDGGTFTMTTSGAFPQAGVYTYYFKENDSNLAGVVYDYDGKITSETEKYFAVRISVITDYTGETPALVVGGISVRPAYASDTADGGYAIDYSKEKLGEIINYYNVGSLEITKTVTGNMGDTTKAWPFTVVFTSPTKGDAQDVVKSIITYSGTATDVAVTGATVDTSEETITAPEAGWKTITATFKLTHGQSIKFVNIPCGVTYTVAETGAGQDGYTTTITGSDTQSTVTKSAEFKDLTADPATQASGTITVTAKIDEEDIPTYTADDDVLAYVNDKNVDIDTGVSIESAPYMMIMALAFMGIVVMISRKRREQE